MRLSRDVDVVLSKEREMPMTWGVFSPVILLPDSAMSWSKERLQMVLLHELAHIARWDCLTQMLGQLARALYWFNPLAWMALHRLRTEQESACDDVVLQFGSEPTDYASLLLEVTARLPSPTWDASVALAIGRCSRMEQRLRAILHANSQRQGASAKQKLVIFGAMTFLACGVAGVERRQAIAETPPATDAIAVEVETQTGENTPQQKQAKPQPDQSAQGGEEENQQGEKPAVETSANEAGELIEHVYRKIAEVTPGPVNRESLREAAIQGMLKSLNDPYSALFSRKQMREFQEAVEGKMVGIGAVLAIEDNTILITSVLPNSPARDGGLLARDIILKVDDEPTGDLVETVKRIRGELGTDVKLTILRAGETLHLSLKRDEVRLSTVKGTSIQGHSLDDQSDWLHWLDVDRKIAFVQITHFDKLTPRELSKTLTRLKKQNLRGLVLDLRGNRGGLMMSSVEVARLFLKNGTIVEARGSVTDTYTPWSLSGCRFKRN